MSSADVAAKLVRTLENNDLRVLQVIESAMSQHEFVSEEQIADYTRLDLAREVDFRLNRLDKMGLIYRMQGAYTGYTLNYAGYDCLALNALVKGDVIDALGKSLGVGKEADVYDALTPQNTRVAIKFHRLGRISFRQTQRKRGYIKQHASWIFQSRLAAEKEYRALQLLSPQKVAVPEPISQNRHVIVMSMIEGGELARYRRITRARNVLKEILRNIRRAYMKAGIVHADLSEYNILLKPDGHILIIDWPQYVTKDHPNAQSLLARDIENILSYFSRKHKIKTKLEEALEYIMGKKRSMTD